MFNRKLNTDAFTSLIAEGMTVNGTICFQGILKIDGDVGSILVHGESLEDAKDKTTTLIVGKTGNLRAEKIVVTNAILEGVVSSQFLSAEDTVRITKSAKVTGSTIYYRTLEIEPGAHIHECRMVHADFTSKTEQT